MWSVEHSLLLYVLPQILEAVLLPHTSTIPPSSYISLLRVHILCAYAIRPRDLSPSTCPDCCTRYGVYTQSISRVYPEYSVLHTLPSLYSVRPVLTCSICTDPYPEHGVLHCIHIPTLQMHVHSYMYAMLRQRALIATVSPLSCLYPRSYRILHIHSLHTTVRTLYGYIYIYSVHIYI